MNKSKNRLKLSMIGIPGEWEKVQPNDAIETVGTFGSWICDEFAITIAPSGTDKVVQILQELVEGEWGFYNEPVEVSICFSALPTAFDRIGLAMELYRFAEVSNEAREREERAIE